MTGCPTITGIGNTPEITPEAYVIVNPTTIEVDLSLAEQISEVGGSGKILKTDENQLADSVIIARTDENTYVAAQLGCTHRGVELEYKHEDERFQCPSIGHSKFYLDGTNDGGPAQTNGPNPLRSYSAEPSGNILTILIDLASRVEPYLARTTDGAPA
jgi:hypothetical protein